MATEVEKLNVNVKQLIDGMKQNFQKAADTIGGHVKDVMSEEISMTVDTLRSGFDSLKGAGESTVEFLKNGFVWEKTVAEKEQKKQTKALLSMEEMMSFQMKRTLLTGKQVGKGFLKGLFSLLGIPIIALGAAIGGIMAVIIKPFQVLKKLIAPVLFIAKLGLVKSIIALSAKFPWFLKGIRVLQTIGTWFGKLISLPGINLFVKGFSWGFKKLFWPLQLIISAIDFVKGFQATEGDMLDKIKGGIKNVIIKFFEFPIRILGNAWDWLLRTLGIVSEEEMGKSADKLLKGLGSAIDFFFKGFKFVFSGILEGLKWAAGKIMEADWAGMYGKIKEWVMWFIGIPRKIQNKVTEWTSWLPAWLGGPKKTEEPKLEAVGATRVASGEEMKMAIEDSNIKADERKHLMQESNDLQKEQVKQLSGLQEAIKQMYGLPIPFNLGAGGTEGRMIREDVGDYDIVQAALGFGD